MRFGKGMKTAGGPRPSRGRNRESATPPPIVLETAPMRQTGYFFFDLTSSLIL